jgi:hypothetical protein
MVFEVGSITIAPRIIHKALFISEIVYIPQQYNVRRQGVLVSLVGTIASGLTWGGGVFISPLVALVKEIKIVTLAGF